MSVSAKTEAIAAKLCADWERKSPYETLSGDLRPDDLDEAYQAQVALQRLFIGKRGPLAGRKIALTSKAMQEMCGIDHPCAGAFFERDVRRSPAEIARSEFRHVGIEFELAVRLAIDVTPGMAPHDAKTVRGLIAGVAPAFELIEDRGVDYASLDVLTLVADNSWCGGVVLGADIEEWAALDLSSLSCVVSEPGVPPEQVVMGAADPLGSLAWVLNHANALGETVRAGEVVITGSVVRTRFPNAGTRYRFEIIGHGFVEMAVV